MRYRRSPRRRGVAAVEFAFLLPILAFLFVIAVDFARVFYYSCTITNCARQGAIRGSDPAAAQSPYASVQAAALADATNLNPQPTVDPPVYGPSNSYVEVTVHWSFSTITNYPGVPHPLNLSRTIRMPIAQSSPN